MVRSVTPTQREPSPDQPARAAESGGDESEVELVTAPEGYYTPRMPRVGLAGRLPGGSLPYRLANRIARGHYLRRMPMRLPAEPPTRLIRLGGRLQVVETVPVATGRRAALANRDLVVDLCEQLSIEYFAIPESDPLRHRIGVPAEDWTRLVTALLAEGTRRPLYFGVQAVTRTGAEQRWYEGSWHPKVARAALEQPELEVFRSQAAGGAQTPFGRQSACVVDRWYRDENRTLVAPSRNERAPWVTAKHQVPVTTTIDGREVRTFDLFTRRDIFAVDFPVDAVYLWVDGSDPEWVARKQAASAGANRADEVLLLSDSIAEARFRESGELRYSMRSLEQYAPWIRHIFLVTDKQVPDWLDQSHPKVRVVDHSELFGDAGALPTFNSHAIGARLHHIEGLSEQYLYLNDDVFLGRDQAPSNYFQSNGVSYFFLSRSTLGDSDGTDAPAHEQARRNVADLLARDFGRTPSRAFFHTPIPQRRSTMFELEARYPEEFARTWRSQFRSGSDLEINSWLHNYYGYLTGAASPGRIRYDYFDLADPTARKRMTTLAAVRDRDAFCVNDNPLATADQLSRAVRWLRTYFPQRCSFEVAGS